MTVFGAGFAATSEHFRVVVIRRLHSQPRDGQEVGATHPDHTKRSASLLAVLWQAVAHNSYHIGQVVMMRSSLGAWPPKGGGDSW
jgi:uncharacterized damage-inducible protein DinB